MEFNFRTVEGLLAGRLLKTNSAIEFSLRISRINQSNYFLRTFLFFNRNEMNKMKPNLTNIDAFLSPISNINTKFRQVALY